MIPNETKRTFESTGTTQVIGDFKITSATQARILVSLSDKMYTRKELAFIREYSTNAADAHIVAKKPISEIIVTMPTLEDLTFRIRDFGSGLTQQQIADVYCIFGESTKRNSNEQNGMLGYGCKAGFAHSDSFTVTSWINGEKSIYQCVKGDSSKLHSAVLLNRTKSNEPSGLEVAIPVKQSSLWTVHIEAVNFYKHWPEIPTINGLNDDKQEALDNFRKTKATLTGKGWEIRPKADGSASGVAYMGFVAYNIDWNVLGNRLALNAHKRILFELLQSNDVTLHFKMGEVQFVDSRESLEYTDATLKALTDKIENIFSKIRDSIQEKFASATNIWEAKKVYNSIFGNGELLKEYGDDEDESSSTTVTSIKILDGNLERLEESMRDSLKWNGIIINGGKFAKINRFDNALISNLPGDKDHHPHDAVMITYARQDGKCRCRRCSLIAYNSILASDRAIVVINDTDKKSSRQVVSRYLLFKNGSNAQRVHVLTFNNDTLKENFYKEYNFDSVPVLYVSDLIDDAKQWVAANKSQRGTSGEYVKRPMRRIDVKNGTVTDVEISLKDIEDDVTYYLEAGTGRRLCHKFLLGNNYVRPDSDAIAHIARIVKEADLDVDVIYIINKKVTGAKWFETAKKEETWVNFYAHIHANIPDVDVQTLVDANYYSHSNYICRGPAKKVKDLILFKDKSPLHKFIIDLLSLKDGEKQMPLINTLKYFGMWDNLVKDTKTTLNFEDAREVIQKHYPLLTEFSGVLEYEDRTLDAKTKKRMMDYINATDLYVDLYPDNKELTEEVEVA